MTEKEMIERHEAMHKAMAKKDPFENKDIEKLLEKYVKAMQERDGCVPIPVNGSWVDPKTLDYVYTVTPNTEEKKQ